MPKNIRVQSQPKSTSIIGERLADVPTFGFDVLIHQCIRLEKWEISGPGAPFWRLYYPLSTGAFLVKDSESAPLDTGMLYLIPPHSKLQFEARQCFSKWYLHFTVSGLVKAPMPGVYCIEPSHRIAELLAEVCPARDADPVLSHPAFLWRVTEFLSLVLSHAPDALWNAAISDPRLERAIALMESDFTEKLTVSTIDKTAGLSERAVSELFVQHTGLSPIRYLIELRLNHAYRLLKQTDLPIESVAEQAGFANRFYLTRIMKKYRNNTPAAFRVQMKG
jgi:AraC-like DNA-binding protein